MVTVFFAVLILTLLTFFVFLLLVSPGKPGPLKDKFGQKVQGSLCEKIFIKIGGVQQCMFIRAKHEGNPVLLFVHGGPSFSEYFLVEKYPTGLEDYFTVCYWEQRGGGASCSPGVTLASMTLEQLASDAIEVTNYLRDRFKKEKIYIMAHSGGTAFAIRAVAGSPQLFHAYVGISQITSQAESEKIAYNFMLDQYRSKGDSAKLSAFAKYPLLRDDSFILPFFNSVLRDKSMHELGIGTMHNMKSIMSGVFYPVWLCRAYTLREKFNIWHSKFSFVNKSGLRRQVISLNIQNEVPGIDIPAYFLSGKYDLTVNHDLSKEYLKELQSPLKGFYSFENSAHSPMFEEPGRFLEIMVNDVLHHTANMADK